MILIFGIDYLKKHFNHSQRYIIVAILSLFIPFYMCAAVIIFLTVRLLYKGEIQQAYKDTPKSQYIIMFTVLAFIVSLIYQNYMGALCSIGLLFILSFVLYYRRHITIDLFDFITNCIVVLSVFAALYGLIEYIGILNSVDIDTFEIIIFNSPKQRVNSVFFNANYYAMMIEFFICITFYKMLKLKSVRIEYKKFSYYSLVIFLNLFLLILTACRTAWPALCAGVLIMLIVDKRYKSCAVIFSCCLLTCIYFVFNPTKFPRVDNIIDYFMTRADIWSVAVQNIKTHFFFGEGPMTYMHIYPLYNGHPTEHAHSIYLDPLLCFGIVGLLTISPFIYNNVRSVYRLWKSQINKTLVALMIGFTVMVFVHGVLDYTIFFVQTGVLFLLIASSFDIYKSKLSLN